MFLRCAVKSVSKKLLNVTLKLRYFEIQKEFIISTGQYWPYLRNNCIKECSSSSSSSNSLLHRNILSKCCFYSDRAKTQRKH